jgi:hypothetical protein
VGKKSATVDRKAKLEEVRKAQKAVERRRTLLVGGAAGVVVLALIVAVGVVIRKQIQDSDMTRVGVTAAAASCDPVTNDPSTGVSDHIGPGTDFPNETTVKYATIPPSSGKHLAVPIVPARDFYTAKDRPAVETLVHNLEHGYTILWYDQTVADDDSQMNELRGIADKFSGTSNLRFKFKAVPWLESDGKAFPKDQHIAFTHWS